MTDTTSQAIVPTSHPIRRVLADWTVIALDGPVPRAVRQHTIAATVPGSVHTDLLAAGLIPDPYFDGTEQLRDTRLGAPSLSSSLERIPNGYRLTVTAATLTRDLAVLVDKVDPAARVDDMLITLLPGESATFSVRSEVELELDCATLTAPTVLRSANQLMRP